MHAHSMSDQQVLARISHNPQDGLAILIEKYTGLLWHVVSRYLQNPEDIKECVNETFARFYFQRDTYDPRKSSLSLYLAIIARNLAVSRYRKENRRYTMECSAAEVSTIGTSETSRIEDSQIALAEFRLDLKKAAAQLRPDEAALIRMKYYDGMTTKEIAATLGLPYETVKKRQHRSIKKLRRSLLLSLILMAFLLLSACTYYVLRHYDLIPSVWEMLTHENETPDHTTDSNNSSPLVLSSGSRFSNPEDQEAASQNVPSQPEPSAASYPEATLPRPQEIPDGLPSFWLNGYGPVFTPDTPTYSLTEAVHFETAYVTGTLEDAVYADGNLKISFFIQSKEGSFTDLASRYFPDLSYLAVLPDFQSICQGDVILTDAVSAEKNHVGSDYTWTCRVFSGIEFPSEGDSVELCLASTFSQESLTQIPCELRIPFTLSSSSVQDTSGLFYEISENYSILAVPRRENGSLIVSICPYSADGVPAILPALIRGSYGSKEEGTITLTGTDGAVYQGACVRYSPGDSTKDYYDWDFGSVPPGDYTLELPYLYLSSHFSKDFSIPIDLSSCTWEDRSWPVDGGSITVDSVTPIPLTPGEPIPGTNQTASDCPGERAFKICLKCDADTDAMEIFDLFLSQKSAPLPDTSHFCGASSSIGQVFLEEDPQVIEFLVRLDTYTFDPASFQLTGSAPLSSGTNVINYRWNIRPSFSLTID